MSGLRYLQARKREIKDDNRGLPSGAVKCTDKKINELLQKIWIKKIRFYNDTNCCINRPLFEESYKVEESGFESELFAKQLNPIVEGYIWFRGFAINVSGGKVLIFSGWIQPWRRGGAPDPIVYVLGEVYREDVLKVVQAYYQGIERQIAN